MPGTEDQRSRNRELLRKAMMDAVRMHMWAMQSITTKARAILAVGAIVASILVAGLGSAAGLLGGDPGAHVLLWSLPAWAIGAVGSFGITSIVSILLSIYHSMRALRTISVTTMGHGPFARDDESMDWVKLAKWVDMDEEEIYKHVHNAYFEAMKSLKRYNSGIADHTNRGRSYLLAGLCLGFAFAVATFALSLAVGAPRL